MSTERQRLEQIRELHTQLDYADERIAPAMQKVREQRSNLRFHRSRFWFTATTFGLCLMAVIGFTAAGIASSAWAYFGAALSALAATLPVIGGLGDGSLAKSVQRAITELEDAERARTKVKKQGERAAEALLIAQVENSVETHREKEAKASGA